MNKKINESFSFLIAEYERLKLKEVKGTLTRGEKEALIKLASFIDKDNE